MAGDATALGYARPPCTAPRTDMPESHAATKTPNAAMRARFIAALVATSFLAAGFAIGVRLSLAAVTHLLFGPHDVLSAFRGLHWSARIAAPAVGALVGGLIAWAATKLPESRGVSDVMEAVVLGRGRISLRAAIAKAAASFAAIVSGGSLGREGPLIQVGAALGGTSARWLGLAFLPTRTLYAAGAAAGFAAAYNTPIAGTLFVLEVVVGVAALELVVPVAFAAAIATAVSRLALGDQPVYGIRTYALVTTPQLASSVLLGPLGGLAAVGFMRLLVLGERLFERTGMARPLRAALGGLIVGLIATQLPEVTGNGAESIREMLDGRVLGVAFVLLLIAKPLATTASVSSGSAGGVFTPSMFLGAAMGGGLASIFLGGVGADRVPVVGACALVGMASVVAATTHAPLMASALAFEMSGDYALVVPLLLSTALATATARLFRPDSIYASELSRRGIRFDRSLARMISASASAGSKRDSAPP
jgi:CIC family chloride channel protein